MEIHTQVGAAEHRNDDVLEAVLQVIDVLAHAVNISLDLGLIS